MVNFCGKLRTMHVANNMKNDTIKAPEMVVGKLDQLDPRYLVAPATAHQQLNIDTGDRDDRLLNNSSYRYLSVYFS